MPASIYLLESNTWILIQILCAHDPFEDYAIRDHTWLPYYRKLTLHEINVLEINANLMENDFRIKKINAKDEVKFHSKGN